MVKEMHAAEGVKKKKNLRVAFADVAVCHVNIFSRGTLPRVTKS
jgi:hypothetical protein